MRAVVQRVSSASVTIDNQVTAKIGRGLVILLGIQHADTSSDLEWLATKIVNLRIFPDRDDKMNLSIQDLSRARVTAESHHGEAQAEVLVVSQFTLLASTRKGNRPSFNDAAKPPVALSLYDEFRSHLERILEQPVATGSFGAMMQVALVNDGPVTIILDSRLRE